MGQMSIESTVRVINLWKVNYMVRDIVERLAEEGKTVSKAAMYDLMAKYKRTGLVEDLRRTPCPRKLAADHMADNSDLTSRQHHSLFTAEYPGVDV